MHAYLGQKIGYEGSCFRIQHMITLLIRVLQARCLNQSLLWYVVPLLSIQNLHNQQ